MRELVVTTFITLDGVMQAPGAPDEDRDGGFPHGGWSAGYWDDMMGALVVDWMQQQDAVLLGRRTYEIFAAHWPRVPDTDPMAARLNQMPKYVASRTLTSVDWNNARLIRGHLADAVMEMKRLLGTGKRLFGNGIPARGLDLVESRTSGTGVTIVRYRPAAEIRSGSFALP